MKLYEVSQLPVLDADGKVVGILDESYLLAKLMDDANAFNLPVKSAMVEDVQTLELTSPIDALIPVFKQGRVAVVVDHGKFLGLITQMDLIHFRRRKTAL